MSLAPRRLVQAPLQHARVEAEQGEQVAAEVLDGRLVEQHLPLQQQELEEDQRPLPEGADKGARGQAHVELLRVQHVVRQARAQVVVRLERQCETF